MRANPNRIRTAIVAIVLTATTFIAFGRGETTVSGELKQWHKVTVDIEGPFATEGDADPNPFLDYRMTVTFVHESGSPRYLVPGYFAADGDAANSSAREGRVWRAHLSPDKPGRWDYEISFVEGKFVAVHPDQPGERVRRVDGRGGSFHVLPTDKSGDDFRYHGRLRYVGERYLKFAGSGEYFLKAGADSPENLLACVDIDGTYSNRPGSAARTGEASPPSNLKSWTPHVQDWGAADPVWKGTRGKGLIGALNYLASKGCNAFSFLTYNAGGDGDDVWPFVHRDDRLRYDCSKLDQWQIIFDHAQSLGLHAHFKLQETENDDLNHADDKEVTTALDNGETGIERRLYLRELIARFGYLLALNWNLGEENTQTPEQQRAMAAYIREMDPYGHHIVIHTYPDQQDAVYSHLLGDQSVLTGASLQNSWADVHSLTLKWIQESRNAGKQWVVANDEQNPHHTGVPPDPGFEGFDGTAHPESGSRPYSMHDVRKYTLWGNLMAGGAGVEYYFGYTLPQTDLNAENWRSRDRSWDYCRIALQFFREFEIPFWRMNNADELVGNGVHDNSRYCLAIPGKLYVVYLPDGGPAEIDLGENTKVFRVHWFNPRTGGSLRTGSVNEVRGYDLSSLGEPPEDPDEDWVVLIRETGG